MKDTAPILDNEFTTITIQNGIIISTWKKHLVDLETAKGIIKSRLQISMGKKYPVLIKIQSINGSTKEARNLFASEEGSKEVSAVAIYIDSIVDKMIATVFINMNKPKIPTKIFNNEIKALIWLEQFK